MVVLLGYEWLEKGRTWGVFTDKRQQDRLDHPLPLSLWESWGGPTPGNSGWTRVPKMLMSKARRQL